MSKNNISKKHHYVPKLYLRNFAHLKKNSERLYTSRRRRSSVAFELIENVACENDYNRINVLEDPLSWEKNYANTIEPHFKKQIELILQRCNNKLITKGAPIISDTEKKEFAWDIVYQMLRGPAIRNFLKYIYPDIVKSSADETKRALQLSDSDLDIMDVLADAMIESEDIFKHTSALMLMNSNRISTIARLIYNKTWVFIVAPDDLEWISSDNPIIAINLATGKSTPMVNNLMQPGTIISFPLSPKVLLEVYDYGYSWGAIRELDRTRIFLSKDEGPLIVDSRNSYQKEQCLEVFYAYSEETIMRYV